MDKEKQKIQRRLRVLREKMAQVGPVMRGSVVMLGTRCGNPSCKCARGEKHQQYFYSLNKKGKTILAFLGKSREPKARQYTDNYKAMVDIMEEMTMLNLKLLKLEKPVKSR